MSLAILIPLATTNRLPDFHWKSVSVGAPTKPLTQERIVRTSTSPHAGSVSFPRVFTLPARTSRGNRTESSDSPSFEPPQPDGIFVSEPSRPLQLTIDHSAASAARVKPPEPALGPRVPPGPRRVSQGVQMAKLMKMVTPEYPPLAKTARVSGVVHLIGIIAKDGTIQNLQLISGHPLLARAAMEAVKQWIYQPTLLNGEAVEVIAPIDVNFTLGQ